MNIVKMVKKMCFGSPCKGTFRKVIFPGETRFQLGQKIGGGKLYRGTKKIRLCGHGQKISQDALQRVGRGGPHKGKGREIKAEQGCD